MSSSVWQAHLQAYQEQIRLEEYQRKRTLLRPKTTKFTVAVHGTLLLVLAVGFVVALALLSPLDVWLNILISVLYIIGVTETYGRLLGIKIVECYQHYATEATRRKCKCVPSCSEYAILCLKKYELIRALRKIRKRLFVTCKGFDYILDEP